MKCLCLWCRFPITEVYCNNTFQIEKHSCCAIRVFQRPQDIDTSFSVFYLCNFFIYMLFISFIKKVQKVHDTHFEARAPPDNGIK